MGNKVADCVLLFSLNKLEAFPLDRWMIRILEKYYSKQFQLETKTITEKQYEILHEKIVNHFGPFAGEINDSELINAIQYLAENGIIQIN